MTSRLHYYSFDYGEKFWLVKYKQFLCDCGCKSCKYNKDTIQQTLEQNMSDVQQPVYVDDSPLQC